MSRVRSPNQSAPPGAVSVVARVRAAIIEGELSPGQRLREDVLATELRVSRTPIREALRILTAEGLVESTPYVGSRVRVYDANEVEAAMQARALTEGLAGRRAAARAQPHHIERMLESCERFETLGPPTTANIDAVITENFRFHELILDAADSRVLADTVRKLWDLPMARQVAVGLASGDQKLIAEHSHRQLTKALSSRDADWADDISRAHVQDLREQFLAHQPSA
jgi:DNA-binding GntR family transcriptional regulator